MRERKTGTVVFMGSLGGYRWMPYCGTYCTTKWALRALSLSLHDEISPLGLRSTCIDFGYFRTNFLQPQQRASEVSRIPDYEENNKRMEGALQAYNGKQPGDPTKGTRVVVDIVRGEGAAANRPFPTNVCLGSDCYEAAKTMAENTLKRVEEWRDVSMSTDF
ncbi:hypothetical protein CVT24_005270 [Panaeolus cyanescens]|uniref:Uncharacterized protein n=1 Tax=Panaeolus cyanescens TaxID=181874 RepID=A0A409Y927_9AGAR|nr:hypothetical protein CVT24_005270 [Panaeolus cyanescens]